MEIKKCLDTEEFQNFTASNGWLESQKVSHGVRERKLNGRAAEDLEYTISVWMEKIKDYEPVDIWNMDETGCFFQALPEKGLAE